MNAILTSYFNNFTDQETFIPFISCLLQLFSCTYSCTYLLFFNSHRVVQGYHYPLKDMRKFMLQGCFICCHNPWTFFPQYVTCCDVTWDHITGITSPDSTLVSTVLPTPSLLILIIYCIKLKSNFSLFFLYILLFGIDLYSDWSCSPLPLSLLCVTWQQNAITN
jgi:hypothetical protein